MSSSLRRRATPTGAAPSTSASPTAGASAAGTRRSRSSTHSKASSHNNKKRRYVDIENRCRNPFCGAPLENKKQRYCDGNKFCQLRRGLALLCAWPQAPPDNSNEHRRRDATPAAASGSSGSAMTATAGDKRPHSTETLTPTAAAAKKPRSLQRHASTDSLPTVSAPITPTPTPTPPPTPTSAPSPVVTTTNKAKAAPVDVVPLGVGNRTGGGGRYVRSGNRAEISTSGIVRPPSFSRFPTAPTTPTTATLAAPATTGDTPAPPVPAPTPALLPTPPASVSSAPPSRTLSRANSLPVTTTNRSRDPRVRTAAAPTNGDVAAPVRKTMSAADYLSKTRNKDAAAAPTETTLSTARPPLDARPPTLNAPPPAVNYASRDVQSANLMPLRRAQSDTTTHAMPYDGGNAKPNDWHGDCYSRPPTRFRASEDWHRPRETSHGYEPPHQPYAYANTNQHRGFDRYNNASGTNGSNCDRPMDAPPYTNDGYDRQATHREDERRPSSTPYRNDEHAPREQESARAPPSAAPSISRAEDTFRSLLRPKFSHCDPFLKLILTRMASFLPEEKVGIRAISYKTTTKRKLKWYLDYAKRVEDCCGELVKLTVDNGVAKLTIAGREWMVIHGTSTSDLYHAILLRLYEESTRWRKVIMELKSVHSVELRTRSGGAIPGVSFLKFWSAMKNQEVGEAADLDFQSTFTLGNNYFHWTFCLGNVEIGSGSAVEKVDAVKAASSSAYHFLNGLTILDPHEKHRVTDVDAERRANPARTSSRPSSSDSSCRRNASASSSSRSTSATARGSGSAGPATSSSATSASTTERDRPPTRPSSASRDTSSASRPASSSASVPSTSGREPVVDAPPAAERSVSDDDDDRMSISSKEDGSNDKKQSTRDPPAPPTTSTLSSAATAATTTTSTTTTAKANGSTAPPPAAAATTTAAAPAAPTTCRFCEGIKKTKPDMVCMICLRKR